MSNFIKRCYANKGINVGMTTTVTFWSIDMEHMNNTYGRRSERAKVLKKRKHRMLHPFKPSHMKLKYIETGTKQIQGDDCNV